MRIDIVKLNTKNEDLIEENKELQEELNKKEEELNAARTSEVSNPQIQMSRIVTQSLARNDLNMRRPSVDVTEMAPQIQILKQEKLDPVKSESESDTEEKKENLADEIKEVIDPSKNINSTFTSYDFKSQTKSALFTTSEAQDCQTEQQSLIEIVGLGPLSLMKKLQSLVVSENIGEIEIIKLKSDYAIETDTNPMTFNENCINYEINRIKQYSDYYSSMDQQSLHYSSKDISVENFAMKKNTDISTEQILLQSNLIEEINIQYSKPKNNATTYSEPESLSFAFPDEITCCHPIFREDKEISVELQENKVDSHTLALNLEKKIERNSCDAQTEVGCLSIQGKTLELFCEKIILKQDNEMSAFSEPSNYCFSVNNMEVKFQKEKKDVGIEPENLKLTHNESVNAMSCIYKIPKQDYGIELLKEGLTNCSKINSCDIESHVEKQSQESGSENNLIKIEGIAISMAIQYAKEKEEMYAFTDSLPLKMNENLLDVNCIYSKPKQDESIFMDVMKFDVNNSVSNISCQYKVPRQEIGIELQKPNIGISTRIHIYDIESHAEKHNQEVGSENIFFNHEDNILNTAVEFKKEKVEVYASTENTPLKFNDNGIEINYAYSKPKQDQIICMDEMKMDIKTNINSHDIERHAGKQNQETASEILSLKIDENTCNCVIEYHPIKPISIRGSVLDMEIQSSKEKAEAYAGTDLIHLEKNINLNEIDCIYSKQKKDECISMDELKLNVNDSVNILSCIHEIPKQDVCIEVVSPKIGITSNIDTYNVKFSKEKHSKETFSDFPSLKIEEAAFNCAIEYHPIKNITIDLDAIALGIQNIKEKAESNTGTEMYTLDRNDMAFDFNHVYTKPRQDESMGMENLCLNINDSVNLISCLNKIPKQDIGIELIEKNMEICSKISSYDIKFNKEKHSQEIGSDYQPLQIAESTPNCSIEYHPIKPISIITNILNLAVQNIKDKAETYASTEILPLTQNKNIMHYNVTYSKEKKDQSISVDEMKLVVGHSVNDFDYSYKIPRKDYGIDLQEHNLEMCPKISSYDIERHAEKHSQESGSDNLLLKIDNSTLICAIDHHPLKQIFIDANILNIAVDNIKQKTEISAATDSPPLERKENNIDINFVHSKQKHDQSICMEEMKLTAIYSLNEFTYFNKIPKTDSCVGQQIQNLEISSRINTQDYEMRIEKNCKETSFDCQPLKIDNSILICAIEHHPIKPISLQADIQNIAIDNIKQKIEASVATENLPIERKENINDINLSYSKGKQDVSISLDEVMLISNDSLNEFNYSKQIKRQDIGVGMKNLNLDLCSKIIVNDIECHVEKQNQEIGLETLLLKINDSALNLSIESHSIKQNLIDSNILNMEVQNIKQKAEIDTSTVPIPIQINDYVADFNYAFSKQKQDKGVDAGYQDLCINNNIFGDITLFHTLAKEDVSIDPEPNSFATNSHILDCNIVNHIEISREIILNVQNCSIIREIQKTDSYSNSETNELDFKFNENSYTIKHHSEKSNACINTENLPLKIDTNTLLTSCQNLNNKKSSLLEITHAEYCYIPEAMFKKLEITSSIGETTIISYEEEKEDRSTCDEGIRKPEVEETKKRYPSFNLDPQKSFFYLVIN